MKHRLDLPWGLAMAVPLAPLLLAQGRRVRRVTPLLPEPEGPRTGCLGVRHDGPAASLLILGDSSAAGVGAAHQDQALSGQLLARLQGRHDRPLRWKLAARTGLRTRDAIALLEPSERFDLAVIALGVNDVTALQTPAAWLRDVDRLVQHLAEQQGVQRVLWSGLPPMHRFPALPQPLRAVMGQHARTLDRALSAHAQSMKAALPVEHLPLPAMSDASFIATDGFHPAAGAYALWAQALSGRVLEGLGFGRVRPRRG